MKIFFFGSPPCAVPSLNRILNAGHDIALVVTQPDRPSGRGRHPSMSAVKKASLEEGLAVHQPVKIRKDAVILEKLDEHRPDINVVVAYGQIIPASIIYFPPYNSINVHFSLLPGYRGAAPVQWALYHGEKKTGITIFELNEKMDEGKILTQKEADIKQEEDAAGLQARLAETGADLLVDTLARIDDITPVEQKHSLATYAPLLKKENGRIDWSRTAAEITRQIRAFFPWPSSFCFYDGLRLKIIEAAVLEKTPPSDCFPGKIFSIGPEGISVCCKGQSLLLVKTLQPENKKVMDAYAFSRGSGIKPGEWFR